MKELSIEEKAKAYDEAIKIINDYYQKIKYSSFSCASNDREVLERAFPQIKESEDDRIWNEIIEYLKSRVPVSEETELLFFKRCLAWLEKQGEHANFRNKIQIGDKVTRNEDGVLVNLSQLNRVAKKEEKQDEQKPYGQRKECFDCQFNYAGECKGSCAMKIGEQKPADKIEPDILIEESYQQQADDLIDMVTEKSAWSEEDEKMMNDALAMVEWYSGKHENMSRIVSDWLKSLKERVLPQTKQEWSEEYENFMYDTLSNLTELKDRYGAGYGNVGKCIDWLKSLRPQTTWKPSEGQLECLGYAIEKAEKDWSPLANNRIYLTLKALKEQLEKL